MRAIARATAWLSALLSIALLATTQGTHHNYGKTPASTTPTVQQCEMMCTMQYDPVCGSDGVTYGNQCMLRRAQCTAPSLTEVSTGECATSQDSTTTPSPTKQKKQKNEKAAERCEKPCTREFRPVCGSDGVTYANKCLFRNARACKYKGRLTMVKQAACETTPSAEAKSKPNTREACSLHECGAHQECRVDASSGVEYCADVCDATRCGPFHVCVYQVVQCFRAPCPPIATCVAESKGKKGYN